MIAAPADGESLARKFRMRALAGIAAFLAAAAALAWLLAGVW